MPKKNTPAKADRVDSNHPLANCKPLGDRVVVRRDERKTETPGGILLPESATNGRLPIGTVVQAGPGRTTEAGKVVPMHIKVGDRVIMTNYAGLEIRDPSTTRREEDEFVMLREEDILAIAEGRP